MGPSAPGLQPVPTNAAATNPGVAPVLPAATAPVPVPARAAIRVLDGGAGHLLTVRDVAVRLGVSTATVYKLCARGELAHARVSNAIRIAPDALARLAAT